MITYLMKAFHPIASVRISCNNYTSPIAISITPTAIFNTTLFICKKENKYLLKYAFIERNAKSYCN